jgi:hypothetical protein
VQAGDRRHNHSIAIIKCGQNRSKQLATIFVYETQASTLLEQKSISGHFSLPLETNPHLKHKKVKQNRYRPGVAQRVPGS